MQTFAFWATETRNKIREGQQRVRAHAGSLLAHLCWAWRAPKRTSSLSPLCQSCAEPQRRKSASVPGAEQPLPACWLPARLCCIITPAQMANDFVLSSLMSRRRTEQVCSLAAWPFRLPRTKEKRLRALQQHKKGGCFPKKHHFGEQTGHAGHLRLVASHGLGSPSISCSLTHPALSPLLPCCDTDTLCWEGRRFLPCSEGTAKKSNKNHSALPVLY